MIYRRATENSTDDKDATRNVFCHLRITRGYTSVTTRSAAETRQGYTGMPQDVKDTPDGFTDLADNRRWGLRIKLFVADVSL